jgi:hypothetical protein
MTSKAGDVRLGVKAPDFLIETLDGKIPLHRFTARYERLILTTQDSYRYHPN